MSLRKLVVERAKLHYVVLLALLSLLTRSLSDLAHMPFYLDVTGTFLASMLLGPYHGALAGLISGIILMAYYQVYMLMVPFLAILGLILGFSCRKGGLMLLIGTFITVLLYQLSWLTVYTSVFGVWAYFGSYLTSQGGYGLLADGLTSIFIASVLAEGIRLAQGKLKGMGYMKLASLLAILALLLATPTTAILAIGAEEEFKASFPRDPNYVFVCTRMDLVWLPMRRKGTNYYYYPLDRFEKGSPGYQVWVGMYWVQGYVPLTVETVAMFAIWDQNAWLRLHGCPAPYTTIAIVENITDIVFKGYHAKLMYGSLYTRSDVGPDYEHLRLDGFFIVFYDAKRDRTGIIYACATEENFNTYLSELWRLVGQFPLG
ncbi:MAG TPA: hypothetical protein ENF78_06150 [Candidatus Bathyarchaeota archaeon]|nr:hypothetical protein [Candidatus Bathyarchaeota archaeon]